MGPAARQGDLFARHHADETPPTEHHRAQLPELLTITAEQLQTWQSRIHGHQAPLLHGAQKHASQTALFSINGPTASPPLNPLALKPLPLSFWRWPQSPHHGAAIYLVMDRPAHLSDPILLYVGETLAADRRWKGEHDCKAYLAAYGEALSTAGLASTPSIRFWTDVPSVTRERRRLEQHLIQTWLPPFNKETRAHWATPFHAD